MFVQIRSLFELCSYDHRRRARANTATTCPRNECSSYNVLHLQIRTITDKTVAHRQSNISWGVRPYAQLKTKLLATATSFEFETTADHHSSSTTFRLHLVDFYWNSCHSTNYVTIQFMLPLSDESVVSMAAEYGYTDMDISYVYMDKSMPLILR